MKISKEDVIKHITGSAKDNAGCAEKLGYTVFAIYAWPVRIGAQRMRGIIRRMQERNISVPASWKKGQQVL